MEADGCYFELSPSFPPRGHGRKLGKEVVVTSTCTRIIISIVYYNSDCLKMKPPPAQQHLVSPCHDRRVRAKDMRRSLSTTANTSHDKDEPLVQITVKPTKSFFFSGELFEAIITIENVRTKNARQGGTSLGSRMAVDRARASIDGFAQKNGASHEPRRSSATELGSRRLGMIGKQDHGEDQEVELPAKSGPVTSLPVTPKKKSQLGGRSQSVDFTNLNDQTNGSIPSCE
jgi:hypothetical protein